MPVHTTCACSAWSPGVPLLHPPDDQISHDLLRPTTTTPTNQRDPSALPLHIVSSVPLPELNALPPPAGTLPRYSDPQRPLSPPPLRSRKCLPLITPTNSTSRFQLPYDISLSRASPPRPSDLPPPHGRRSCRGISIPLPSFERSALLGPSISQFGPVLFPQHYALRNLTSSTVLHPHVLA